MAKQTGNGSRRIGGTQATRAAGPGRREGRKASQGQAVGRRQTAGRRPGFASQPTDLPAQHLDKPGNEHDLALEPRFLAPDYAGSGKLDGMAAIVTGGDSGIGRAVSILFAREGADVAIVYLSEHEDAKKTKRFVEAEGQRCVLIPGDVKSARFCEEAVEQDAGGLRPAGHPRQQRGLPVARRLARGASPTSSFQETLQTNIGGYFHMARAALPHMGEGGVDHQLRVGDGDLRQQGAARLLGDEGRDPRLHQVARGEPAGARHPRELRRARAGVDAAESCGQARGEGRGVRQEERHGAARATGGDLAGVRVPRIAGDGLVRQRRDTAGHGRPARLRPIQRSHRRFLYDASFSFRSRGREVTAEDFEIEDCADFASVRGRAAEALRRHRAGGRLAHRRTGRSRPRCHALRIGRGANARHARPGPRPGDPPGSGDAEVRPRRAHVHAP